MDVLSNNVCVCVCVCGIESYIFGKDILKAKYSEASKIVILRMEIYTITRWLFLVRVCR